MDAETPGSAAGMCPKGDAKAPNIDSIVGRRSVFENFSA
jgi:hypothetical protein